MRNRFISLILVFCVFCVIQAGFADGRVIRFAGRYVLIDTDVGIGKVGDKVKVYRLTPEDGLVEIGQVKLIKFANGKAAGRILNTRRGANLQLEDIVKPPALMSGVETTRCISAGIALPYTSLGGDFDGTKIARESDAPSNAAPFYVPETESHVGIKGWLQTGIGDNAARIEGLRASYQYSRHDGTWADPQDLFLRRYLEGEDLGSVQGIRLQYHKATFSALFNMYHNERIQILPNIGLTWEIVQLQNALIDRVEDNEYGENNPQVTSILGEGTESYYGSSPNRWLSTSVLGIEIGCDALYFINPNLAVDIGLQYNIYSNLIGKSGQVIQQDGSIGSSLSMNAFNVSVGLAYYLNLDKFIQ
ncbi:hypothetical protein HQ585_14810 [candidate division KSB1 bacterium]|nr:hypothetical protein [candidate division KSB1 bacterium]